MILSSLPDIYPKPLTPGNMAFRRAFHERWGRENMVVLGTALQAEYVCDTPLLTVKKSWGGAEQFIFNRKRLAVDDDHYLVLQDGSQYEFQINSPLPVTSMSVFFRPGMAEELSRAASLGPDALLEHGSDTPRQTCFFEEHVRPTHTAIDLELERLRDGVLSGQTDELWLEEQLQNLLWAMRAAEPGYRARGLTLTEASRSAYMELLARVDRAADYLISYQADAITLDDLAAVANLSKYHLVRLFARVHGATPFEFLAKARARTAHRLLSTSDLSIDEVARLSGHGSRSTLFRQLRKVYGASGRALRQHRASNAQGKSGYRADGIST